MQPPRDQPERAPRHGPMAPAQPCRGKYASLAFAFVLLLSSSVAWAERPVVFRWTDENGIPHYTTQRDRIPSEFRDSVQQIGQPGVPSPGDAPATSIGGVPPPPAPAEPSAPATPAAPTTPSVSSAPPRPTAPAVAPAPVTKPSGPRVMPEGEFEEAPLGSKDTVTPPAPTPVSAPNARNAPSHGSPSADVAAPPPGFSRDSTPEPEASPAPGSDASVAPIAATPAEPPPVAAQPEPASVAVQPEPAPVAKQAAPAPEVTDAPLTPGDAADLDTRIASLEEQVNRDEAAIQSILSQPREADAPRVAERPDFREIAQRLPGLQANLKVLREQRARQSGP